MHRSISGVPFIGTPASFLLLGALAACATVRPPAAPLVSDRPDFTESTETIARGYVQAEGGYTLAHRGEEREQTVGELLVRIGATPRSELRLDVGSYAVVSAGGEQMEGVEDPAIGVKTKLLDPPDSARGRPAVSLILLTTLPAGASPFREHTLQPEAKLAVAWQLAERLALSTNLNYAALSENGKRFGQGAASASFAYDVGERAGVYAEGFAFLPSSYRGPTIGYVNAGVTVLATDDFQVDARAGVQAYASRSTGSTRDYFFGVGVVRRW